jgi:ATP-dependent helicase/nuclease subunit A
MSPLNAGQQEVLDSVASRIVVSAGAGSGKTRVLAERFVSTTLAQEAKGAPVPMSSVLLITFTDKAAGELTERVRRLFLEQGRPDLAREVDGAWISTIHGFCARMVRRHALELGVDPGFAVLGDPQAGLVRYEAFERAVGSLLDDEEIALTLEERGVIALRSSLLSAYDSLRSKGLGTADVRPAPPGPLATALSGLTATIGQTMHSYRNLKQTATVAENLERFVALGERASAILADRAGAASEALGLAGLKGRSHGAQEMKDLTQEVNAALAEVVQAAVDTLAARRAQAWNVALARFDREYTAEKEGLGALDFEDLQLLTRRLWLEWPGTAERYAKQFVEVMVDEFQDTNALQLQVIEPIAHGGLCVVGDVQQSIYRFRDADVSLLTGLRSSIEDDENGHSCRLTVNYRSEPELLDTFNTMFSRDEFFGADYLHLTGDAAPTTEVRWPAGRPRVEAIVVDKSACDEIHWRDREAGELARWARAVVDDGIAKPDDIVVLARSTTTMRPYVDALKAVGLDVLAGAAGGFFAAPEVADVRSLLSVLANPLDGAGVLGLIAGGLGGLSDDALLLLARARQDQDLWAALGEAAELDLSRKDAERAALVYDVVEGLRAASGRVSLADSILHAGSELGSGGGALSRPGAWENVQKAARLASDFERITPADPAAFLRHLGDRETFVRKEAVAGGSPEGGGAIRVMTVHAAKGLEFPIVAVADLGHGPVSTHEDFLLVADAGGVHVACRGPVTFDGAKVPAATSWVRAVERDEALDLEEAKRVFYVACTRAEQALLLTGSSDLSKPGSDTSAIDWVLETAGRGAMDPPHGMSLTVVAEGSKAGSDRLSPPVQEPDAGGPARPPRRPMALRVPGRIPAPEEVSYTALALFEACPYRFFSERMLKVGSLRLRQEGDPLGFGSALHAALELIARGRPVDADRLRALARAGDLGPDAVERLTEAVDAVRSSELGPLLVRGTPEVPFALAVGNGVVRGSMDLVVRDATTATVIDYKTGRTWDAEGGRYAAQAETYAFALLEAGCERVVVRFVHVEAGCEEAVFEFTSSDTHRVRDRIEAAFSAMDRGTFPTRGAFDPVLCGDCPVSGSLCRVVRRATRSRASR